MFATFRALTKLDCFLKSSIIARFLGLMCLLVVTAHCTLGQRPATGLVDINRIRNSSGQFVPNKWLGLSSGMKFVTPSLVADPVLSINDVTANEGDNPAVSINSATFTVTLSAPSQQTVSVRVSTQAGTATENVDFGAGFVDLTIEPGRTSQSVTVFMIGDLVVEGTEQFFLNLSNPVNATIGDGQGVCTIVDDDALILLTEAITQRAIALDSPLLTRESFPIRNDLNFSSDHRTRLALFAIGLKLSPGENASAVTATAEDLQGTVRPLMVEFIGRVPTTDWLTQVVVKLNDQITIVGDVKIRITLHGATSNPVVVSVRP
jgi:hypothetical protein